MILRRPGDAFAVTRMLAVLALVACGGSESPTDSGRLTAEGCAEDQAFVQVCTACGATDACTTYEDRCVDICAEDTSVDGSRPSCLDTNDFCVGGVCVPVICG